MQHFLGCFRKDVWMSSGTSALFARVESGEHCLIVVGLFAGVGREAHG